MIKYALLLFNMFSLIIYQVLFSDDVKLSQSMPSSAKPGAEFTVEVTVNKGAIGGFAKLQQELPEGFTATVVESKGASFTFSNQSVKFIWTSLPSDPEFKVSYKVVTSAQTSGAKTLRGKFSYVFNNERQTADVAPATITIGDEPIAQDTKSSTAPPAETKDTSASTSQATTTQTDPSKTVATSDPPKTEPATAPANPPSGENFAAKTQPRTVYCTRKITKTEGTNEYLVEIKVNKENVTGFAKILETIPSNYAAVGVETSNSSFTFTEQKAKFVWVNLPAQAEFSISYKLTAGPNASASGSIDGVFSYIENDETKKFIIAPTPLQSATSSSLAANTPSTTNTNTAVTTNTTTATTSTNTTTATDSNKPPVSTGDNTAAKQTPPTGEPATTETAQTQPPANTKSDTDKAATTATGTANNTTSKSTTAPSNPITSSIPAPQTGVFYRVQIAATQKYTDMSYFTKKHALVEKIYADMHEGWNKYSVGQHGEYRQARDHREEVKNKGVKGPFVTAFNRGSRITVQEALMITSQKWYK